MEINHFTPLDQDRIIAHAVSWPELNAAQAYLRGI
jgi:hypothetical protein